MYMMLWAINIVPSPMRRRHGVRFQPLRSLLCLLVLLKASQITSSRDERALSHFGLISSCYRIYIPAHEAMEGHRGPKGFRRQ